MRRWWPIGVILLLAGAAGLAYWLGAFTASRAARPMPVPDGDQEIAWLHNPTSGETWENFVWGMKRVEMAVPGVRVDDSAAFPARTTAVPEVVMSRAGYAGKVRVRWYKLTADAPLTAWVTALAARNPAPVAIIGGWTSDRARELAEAMAAATWSGQKPLLLLTTATADWVPGDQRSYAPGHHPARLITLYPRSFRFCFTNRQMAEAVTDFAFTDPALRPGPVVLPGLRVVPAAASGLWAAMPALAELQAAWEDDMPPRKGDPGFGVAWEDDPYSLDLYDQFRDVIAEQRGLPNRPAVDLTRIGVKFSTGRFSRPNPYEAMVVDHILANLPRRGDRTILVIPTVTAPARRVIAGLVQGNPAVATRLVALTGDGISVNTLYRDGEFAWPVRAVRVPLVLFAHNDPFGWDSPGPGPVPPPGYELPSPDRPIDVKGATDDIFLYTTLMRVVARGAYPDGGQFVTSPDELDARFRSLNPRFFDSSGNRAGGSGEYVVVLRPAPRITTATPDPDATIDVYTRNPDKPWTRVHSRPVVQTLRPDQGEGGP